MNVRKPTNFEVYNTGYELALQLYRMTETFPKSEVYNITWQIRKAAVTIPASIAAGATKQSQQEFINSLNYAYCAAKELQVLLQLSNDLGYIPEQIHKQVARNVDNIAAKLFLFIREAERKAPVNFYEEEKEKIAVQ